MMDLGSNALIKGTKGSLMGAMSDARSRGAKLDRAVFTHKMQAMLEEEKRRSQREASARAAEIEESSIDPFGAEWELPRRPMSRSNSRKSLDASTDSSCTSPGDSNHGSTESVAIPWTVPPSVEGVGDLARMSERMNYSERGSERDEPDGSSFKSQGESSTSSASPNATRPRRQRRSSFAMPNLAATEMPAQQPESKLGFEEEYVDRLKSDNVIGAWMLEGTEGHTDADVMRQQHLIQTLYESRLASLHRLVSFMVLFHMMGKLVQDFWPFVSFGLLGYNMSRTQSIMRVASTAAPVSGSEVRHRLVELGKEQVREWAAKQIEVAARLFVKVRRIQQSPSFVKRSKSTPQNVLAHTEGSTTSTEDSSFTGSDVPEPDTRQPPVLLRPFLPGGNADEYISTGSEPQQLTVHAAMATGEQEEPEFDLLSS